MRYTKHFSPKKTSQREPIRGREKNMVKNHAEGYSFKISPWKQLDRFLIIGSEGGTYYVDEHKLTVENTKNVIKLLKEDPRKVVDKIVESTTEGRAPKSDPALFALALAITPEYVQDAKDRAYALSAIPEIIKIPTALFKFVLMTREFRGWGYAFKKALARWYNEKDIPQLIYHIIKYKNRERWSHKDLLRVAHPITKDQARNAIYRYIVKKEIDPEKTPKILIKYEEFIAKPTLEAAIEMIKKYKIPWEAIPNQFYAESKLWETLIEEEALPYRAMIRKLNILTAKGVIKPFSEMTKEIGKRIKDEEKIKNSKIHPYNILVGLIAYSKQGDIRGYSTLNWTPVNSILDAMEEAYYKAFKNVTPTGKNYLIGIDVSSSMSQSIGAISVREAAASMIITTVKMEDNVQTMAFSAGFLDLSITKKDSIWTVINKVKKMTSGEVDCAQPMIYVLKNKIPNVDIFTVYTDNETSYGKIHPVQALKQYRDKYNQEAKLLVVGMTATEISIADPHDPGMLDVVGFDSATPSVISDFAGDRL